MLTGRLAMLLPPVVLSFVLCSNDAAPLRGAVGDQVGMLIQNLSLVVTAFIIAFTYR